MKMKQTQQIKSEPVRKRHQPKGLKIIHDDRDIIVVEKAAGLLTQALGRTFGMPLLFEFWSELG